MKNQKSSLKSKYIVALSIGSYPFGTATSGRHINLLTGLSELGFEVKLFSLYPDKNQDEKSNKLKGEYNQINYQYTTDSLQFCPNKLKRAYLHFLSISKCFYRIYVYNKTQKVIIINFITNPIISFICTLFFKSINLKVVHESTEFPFIHAKRSKFISIIYYKLTLPLFDRVYVISTALKENYSKYIPEEKIEQINIVVQQKKFNVQSEPPFEYDYIAYCGMMNTNKDGVPVLIDAFSKITQEFPNLKLVLIGDISKRPIHQDIEEMLDNKSLRDKVVFTGHINNDQMPVYLNGAKLLALARPDNIQAKGGFPTKLGEYLATGIPVVVTDVGDIPLFIRDNKNGFLSKPNATDFSEKMKFVLNNYNASLKVAHNGIELAKNEFNYLNEAKKIASYIATI